MSLKELVEKKIEDIIVDSPYYLVNIVISDYKSNKSVSVFLDSDSGITIEECVKISRALGKELDEEIEENYTLVVSSPGIDAPLKLERQYKKNIGRKLKVTKTDHSSLTGTILELSDGILKLEKEKEIINLDFNEIKEAKIVISFK